MASARTCAAAFSLFTNTPSSLTQVSCTRRSMMPRAPLLCSAHMCALPSRSTSAKSGSVPETIVWLFSRAARRGSNSSPTVSCAAVAAAAAGSNTYPVSRGKSSLLTPDCGGLGGIDRTSSVGNISVSGETVSSMLASAVLCSAAATGFDVRCPSPRIA